MTVKKTTATFEERLQRLQAVVSRLESAELPLEESVALYKEGLSLTKACREQLDKARNEVRILTQDGAFVPFTEDREGLASDDVSGATSSARQRPDKGEECV